MNHLSLQIDGEGLRQFGCEVKSGVHLCLEVPLGDELYFVDVRKVLPASHTHPAGPVEAPTLDEVAEVVGRMFLAVFPRGQMTEARDQQTKVRGGGA